MSKTTTAAPGRAISHVTPAGGNVFADLGFDTEEAENLKLRAELMMEIERYIERKGLKQKEAAELFGVTQPRVSDLMRGKIERFSIDALVGMLAQAGMRVSVSVKAA